MDPAELRITHTEGVSVKVIGLAAKLLGQLWIVSGDQA